MIGLARNQPLKRLVQRPGGTSPLAHRFVGGSNSEAAIDTAQRLQGDYGISSSLFYLGEYVNNPEMIERNVTATISAVGLLGATDLDVNVSIDPTAIGHMTNQDLCQCNAERIAAAISAQPARARNCLMLDMEDLSLVEPTLNLHRQLMGRGLPVAVTLQARLQRTGGDLRPLLEQPATVRLVKGAFPLRAEHDYQGKRTITENYLTLAQAMLSPKAREVGFYPVFATHDDILATRIIELAQANGWSPDRYEFELLYGVRPDWQRRLRTEGFSVRAYMPFGADWLPYSLRRVGENPRNLLLLGRAILGATYAEPTR